MNRRDAVKTLAAISMVGVSLKSGAEVKAANLKPGQYLIFFNPATVDIKEMAESWPKEWTHDWVAYPIRCGDRPIEECISIYKLDEEAK